MTTVLLFNFPEQEVKSWKFLLRNVPNLRVISVPRDAFGMPILEILQGKKPTMLSYGEQFSDRMLLLADVPDPMIHILLEVCRRVTPEKVLRAVLTETNGSWSASELYRNLLEEDREIRRMQAEKQS